MEEPVEIQPGDAIVNTCVYETTERERMTLGGYGITDEMCVNYMHYYPASELELCKSSIGDYYLDEFFTKMRYFDRANTSDSKSIGENFNSIRWTPLTSAMLSRLYDTSPVGFSCNRSDGTRFDEIYQTEEFATLKGAFKPVRVSNMTTRLARIDEKLLGKCKTELDYGNEDDGKSLERDDL